MQLIKAFFLALGVWVLVLVLAGTLVVARAQSASSDTRDPGSPVGALVALGDSYMSGEGADVFDEGTNQPGVDECRRSPSAYPHAVANALSLKLVFAACSGAVTDNIGFAMDIEGASEIVQYPQSEPLQIERLRAHPEASVVLLSAGGNDARFAQVIANCMGVGAPCVAGAEDWFNSLDTYLQPRLSSTYAAVRQAAPNALVYVVEYPTPFADELTECPQVGLTGSEVIFLRRFAARLNEQISWAARSTGFTVVKPGDAFSSRGLCSTSTSAATLRGWHLLMPTNPADWLGHLAESPINPVMGSFHPTPSGHQVIADRLIQQIQTDLRSGPLPQPGEPGMPPTPPPQIPGGVGTPTGSFSVDAQECTDSVQDQKFEVLGGTEVTITNLQPNSTVCHRWEFDPWMASRADRAGEVTIQFNAAPRAGVSGLRYVIHQDRAKQWHSLALVPPATARPPDLQLWRSWLGSVQGVAAGVAILLAIGLTTWVIHRLLSRRALRDSGSAQ